MPGGWRRKRSALLRQFGVVAVPVAGDVGTVPGCAALIDTVRTAFGGADILINNAGTGSNETIMEAPDEAWQSYWELHVMAAVRLARGPGTGNANPRRRRHPAQRLDLRGAAALV
jgi:NAD(P)-dependent dehydrogenase (short-subunit alcohol dehydrogenase family)